MTEANEAQTKPPSKAESQPPRNVNTADPEPSTEEIEQTRLGILQAVERKEISVEEAMRLLTQVD